MENIVPSSDPENDPTNSPNIADELEDYLKKAKLECDAAKLLLKIDTSLTVTLKCILNSGDAYTCATGLVTNFQKIKQDLGQVFNIGPEELILHTTSGKLVHDFESPAQLGARGSQTLELRLESKDPCRCRLQGPKLDLPVPDIITCTIPEENRQVVVEIENRSIRKPFLGGYRDIRTGVELHHAWTQSGPLIKSPRKEVLTRITQTLPKSEYQTSTSSHVYVQTGEDVDVYPRIVTPRPYTQVPDLDAPARIIQKWFRNMLFRKRLKEAMERYKEREKCEEESEKKETLAKEAFSKREVATIMFPRSRADFGMLYGMVERWRRSETERISNLKTEAMRKAEFCTVLDKEVKLLKTIEEHRLKVQQQLKEEREEKLMKLAAEPVKWTGYRGATITMDTIRTQRAREILCLYNNLKCDMDEMQRLENVLAVKHAIKDDADAELVELLDREAELLARNVPNSKLEFLRTRIQKLFMEFFRKRHVPETKYEQRIMCRLCRKMRKPTENLQMCRLCDLEYKKCVGKMDTENYRKLLKVHEWPMGNDTMKSKMEIDPTTQKDAGYYECQADNQYAIDRRGFRTDYVIYTY